MKLRQTNILTSFFRAIALVIFLGIFQLSPLTAEVPPPPIELIEITGMTESESIIVKWSTAHEENNIGFEVQRSEKENDGYETIAWVDGQGTTNAHTDYHYEDFEVEQGIVYYYRLIQHDTDGTTTYSPVIHIEITPESEEVEDDGKGDPIIYPNPSKGFTFIQWDGILNGSNILVTNSSGRLVQEISVKGDMGSTVQIRNLSPGIYFVRISSNGEHRTLRFVVK